MPWLIGRCVGGLVLLAAALAKARRPAESQDALGEFGLATPAARRFAFVALVGVELALSVALFAGLTEAAYAAAGLMLAFALLLSVQIARGRAGAPCGCFGARSRIGWPGVARNLLLALGFAALPQLQNARLADTGWLAVGLAVALLATSALAVAVLALAREVGALRLALGPQAALEIPHEGPEIGSRVDLAKFEPGGGTHELAVAVFTSEACHVCQALEPAVDFVARDPRVLLRTFDEYRDTQVWSALDVPGSPFAVALDLDGTVLAKGTFNTLGQLESVLATADSRRQMAHA